MLSLVRIQHRVGYMALSLFRQPCAFLLFRTLLLHICCPTAGTFTRITVVPMVNQWFVGLRRHARRLYAIDIDSLLDLLVQMHDDFCLI